MLDRTGLYWIQNGCLNANSKRPVPKTRPIELGHDMLATIAAMASKRNFTGGVGGAGSKVEVSHKSGGA